MPGIPWKPIEDLPCNWQTLGLSEIRSLAEIWAEQRDRLSESKELKEFNQRLQREWAIETGILEHLYTLDRGTTQLLIKEGLRADLIAHGDTDLPAERVVDILKDQYEALDFVLDFIARQRPLSVSYIKELHSLLTRHQESVLGINGMGRTVEASLLRGEWKKLPNNPTRSNGAVHEYCPPEQTSSEIDRLIELHLEHEQKGVYPEVESAWLHHRFTQIHPFQDGNGRVARALASLILLRAGWFPLVVHRDQRVEYLDALEDADRGNLSSLIGLFGKIQKKAFNDALKASEETAKESRYRDVIRAAGERLRDREKEINPAWKNVFAISKKLEEYTQASLKSVSELVEKEIQPLKQGSYSQVHYAEHEDLHKPYANETLQIAAHLEHTANVRTYSSAIKLNIYTKSNNYAEGEADIVIAFYCYGVHFIGIMAASSFLQHTDYSSDGSYTVVGPKVLCREPFQFGYNEEEGAVLKRFEPWLDEVILSGLDEWRRRL